MSKIYSNTDFYLSAFLISKAFTLKGTTIKDQKTVFEFDATKKLQELFAQYYSMTATVEPMAYGAAIRSLKSVIHAANTNSKEQIHNGNKFNNNQRS